MWKSYRNALYGTVLAAMGITFAVLPFVYGQKSQHNLTTQPEPLTGAQIMRGPYMNTGSKDAGADPDWVEGRYVGKSARSFEPSESDVALARAALERKKRAKELA